MWFALSHAALELSLGLHGDFFSHPGVVARGALPVAGPANLEVQGLVYWHPGLMTATQLRAGPAVRVTGPRGGTWGAFVHGGVTHGFWTAPTYSVAPTGEVRRQAFAGDTWAAVVGGVELGHTLRSGPFAGWTARPQFGLRIPTFHGVGWDLGVDIALRLGGDR
jgi:hypothetical protein